MCSWSQSILALSQDYGNKNFILRSDLKFSRYKVGNSKPKKHLYSWDPSRLSLLNISTLYVESWAWSSCVFMALLPWFLPRALLSSSPLKANLPRDLSVLSVLPGFLNISVIFTESRFWIYGFVVGGTYWAEVTVHAQQAPQMKVVIFLPAYSAADTP